MAKQAAVEGDPEYVAAVAALRAEYAAQRAQARAELEARCLDFSNLRQAAAALATLRAQARHERPRGASAELLDRVLAARAAREDTSKGRGRHADRPLC